MKLWYGVVYGSCQLDLSSSRAGTLIRHERRGGLCVLVTCAVVAEEFLGNFKKIRTDLAPIGDRRCFPIFYFFETKKSRRLRHLSKFQSSKVKIVHFRVYFRSEINYCCTPTIYLVYIMYLVCEFIN